MPSVIDVDGGDLARLFDSDAVDLFADLLWADAHALAVGLDMDMDMPRITDAPDGGIDATVKAPLDTAAGPGAIRPGTTRYQIRTERGLDPATMSGISRLLFRTGSAKELEPRIRRCLDGHERLVIVLFGTDTPAAAGGITFPPTDDAVQLLDHRKVHRVGRRGSCPLGPVHKGGRVPARVPYAHPAPPVPRH